MSTRIRGKQALATPVEPGAPLARRDVMRLLLLGLGISAFLMLGACSSTDPTSQEPAAEGALPAATPAPAGALTFHKDVAPILQKVCQNCHVAGGIAPFSLVTYEDAKSVAASIVAQTGSRAMPPWGAGDTSECKPPKAWRWTRRSGSWASARTCTSRGMTRRSR